MSVKHDKHGKQQQALDSLYAIGNVLTIKITMPRSDWDAVRTAQPAGGVCNFQWAGGRGGRYTWQKATSVEISGTSFPAQTMFTEVGVKKKSFCGSINSDKPCLHIDFGKFNKANVPLIEALIGSRYLTLNNTIQDRSYIRQPLGYKLLAMAGLPNSRCNFAWAFVNGTPIGQGVSSVNSPGVFVNAEAVMPRYIERNFNGNMNGNLYELEHGDDFVSARLPLMEPESLSKFNNKADLQFADDYIAANGLAGANQMLDLDQFIKIFAMEFFLKHWDGYANNTNNCYIYNDVNAVEAPGANNVKFRMIPWGVDQIFQPNRHFKMGNLGLIANLVRNDAARLAQLIDQIRTYRDTVFNRETQQTLLRPMIDQMEAILLGLGVPNAVSEVATVRQQLRLAESAGYLCAGLPSTSAAYILKDDSSECLHASDAEAIPAGTPNPLRFEVIHRSLPDDNDNSDLWRFDDLGTGKSVTSQAYGRFLHASSTLTTSQGHKYLYTSAANNVDQAEEFSIIPFDTPDQFTFSGYFKLASIRTNLRATYGSTDTTPGSGEPRVYQDDGSNLYLY
jgi:CotH kinase protein